MATSHLTVLLVEDEPITALSERRMIEDFGHSVVVAGTGERAVEIASNDTAIDLVLMDIDLGSGIDGTEAAERILQGRELPIVFLTSHSEREMVERVKGITRYGYVLKNSGRFVLEEAITMARELFDASTVKQREIEARTQVERQLRERNHFIETILENLPIGLAVNFLDEGSAHYANPKFAEIYGWPAEEISDIATFFRKVYPDDNYRKQITDRVMADIASGDPARMRWEEIEITRKDGTTALVTATNIPIPEQNFMISTVQDVTDLQSHRDASMVQREILDSVDEAIIVTDPSGVITYHNAAAATLYSFPPESALGRRMCDALPCSEPQCDACRDSQWSGELVMDPADGTTFTATVTNHPIRDERGELSAIVSISRREQFGTPVREHAPEEHYLEAELHKLIQRDPTIFTFLRQGSLDGMWYWDLEEQNNEWMDNRFWELFGYDSRDKRHDPAEWQDIIHPDDLKITLENFHKHLEDPDHPYDQIVRYRHKRGGYVYVRCRGIAIRRDDGTPIRMLGVHNDLTEIMERIETEKTLRRELNHRVKNNLSIVRSLVSLQRSGSDQDSDLSDIMHQIDSMVLLHETLQGTDDLQSVEVKPYLRSVLSAVFGSSVRADVSGPDVEVATNVAVPLGLAINELATNAVKHAFHGSHDRQFAIEMCESPTAAHRIRIRVWNSGPPIPESVDLESTDSLGMRLVSSLVSQLDATLLVTKRPNPTFEFDFAHCPVSNTVSPHAADPT